MTTFTGPSRFPLVGSAGLAPGQCLLSGQSQNLVDTGRYIEGYGRVYLSVDIIRELAQSAGVIQPIDATLQQVEWFNDGYSAAVKKEFSERLGDLVRELSGAADRLELVSRLETAETDAVDADRPSGEPESAGLELERSDDPAVADERTPRATGSSKGRSRVQRSSLDDAFGR